MPLSTTPTGDLTKDLAKLRAEIVRVREDFALNPIEEERKKLEAGLRDLLDEEADNVGTPPASSEPDDEEDKDKPKASSSSSGSSSSSKSSSSKG